MARIAGVDLPRNKHVDIALTYIYGIGNARSRRILSTAGVEPLKKVQDLNEDEVNRIRQTMTIQRTTRWQKQHPGREHPAPKAKRRFSRRRSARTSLTGSPIFRPPSTTPL